MAPGANTHFQAKQWRFTQGIPPQTPAPLSGAFFPCSSRILASGLLWGLFWASSGPRADPPRQRFARDVPQEWPRTGRIARGIPDKWPPNSLKRPKCPRHPPNIVPRRCKQGISRGIPSKWPLDASNMAEFPEASNENAEPSGQRRRFAQGIPYNPQPNGRNKAFRPRHPSKWPASHRLASQPQIQTAQRQNAPRLTHTRLVKKPGRAKARRWSGEEIQPAQGMLTNFANRDPNFLLDDVLARTNTAYFARKLGDIVGLSAELSQTLVEKSGHSFVSWSCSCAACGMQH